MEFSPKCVFSICLGISKSAENNFESKNIIREKQRVGGAYEAPPPLGSRWLMDLLIHILSISFWADLMK